MRTRHTKTKFYARALDDQLFPSYWNGASFGQGEPQRGRYQ